MPKIYILGLAGSGKTYLAEKTCKKFNCELYTTDWILYKKEDSYKKIKLSEEEYKKKLRKILTSESWIIEGVHYFEDIAQEANLIIFLDTPIYLLLYRILKRYFTDVTYRKTYGFYDSLNLARKTFKNYYEYPDANLSNYPKYKNRKKYLNLLKKYKGKVETIR